MFNAIQRIIVKIRNWLNRRNEVINSIAKGAIYGNMINSLGGGVSIGGAL